MNTSVQHLPLKPSEIVELEINDESVLRIVLGLALECHEFVARSGVTDHSVQQYLPMVLGVLDRNAGDLLDCVEVSTLGASDLSALQISFSEEGYRSLAVAAKDVVAGSINGDARIV